MYKIKFGYTKIYDYYLKRYFNLKEAIQDVFSVSDDSSCYFDMENAVTGL